MSSPVLLCRNGKQLVPQAEEGLTLLHIEAPQLHGWVSVPEEGGRRGGRDLRWHTLRYDGSFIIGRIQFTYFSSRSRIPLEHRRARKTGRKHG